MLCSAPIIWCNASQSAPQDKDQLTQDLAVLSERNRIAIPSLEAWARLWADPSAAANKIIAFVGSNLDFVALGFTTGVASGIIGIGGGLAMNAYMNSFHPQMPQHEVVATSLLVAVPIGLSGSLVHYKAGRINPASAVVVAGAALVTTGLTSRFVKDVDDVSLKRFFAGVLVASSLTMMR